MYLYIEASYPRKDGDNARLMSPVIPSDKTTGKSHCFTFWFHMYGPHINALNVYKLAGGSYTKLWTRSGNNGDVWRYGQLDLTSSYTYQVYNYMIALTIRFHVFFFCTYRCRQYQLSLKIILTFILLGCHRSNPRKRLQRRYFY